MPQDPTAQLLLSRRNIIILFAHELPQLLQTILDGFRPIHVPDPHVPLELLPTSKSIVARHDHHACLFLQRFAEGNTIYRFPVACELHKCCGPGNGLRPAAVLVMLDYEALKQLQVRFCESDVATQKRVYCRRTQRKTRHSLI